MTNTAEGAAADGEYARAKTSVWWDIENCPVPKGLDAHGIAQKINSALMNMNYCGPLSISAYGNTDLISKSVQQALSSTGVSLNHVPSGRKDASDKKILVDMFLWMVENPAPANIMLISGDGDFSDALHRLRMRRYNILLAHPQHAPPSLLASAKTSWLWRSLLTSGCPLTQCQCSRLVDHGSCSFDSEISIQDVSVSDNVLSTQVMDSGSGSSKAARKKLKGINVQRETNQLLQQETKGKNFRQKWFCKVCNVACKSIEIFTTHLLSKEHAAQLVVKWELEQNLDLLGEPENVAAALSECHEQDVEITSKVVEAGVEVSAHCGSPSVVKKQAESLGQALVDAKNIGESVQGNDLQSRDAQESSMKCLEKLNNECRETITASERSGREFWQDFKERLDRNGVAPLNVDHVFSELSRDFRVPKEVRECFDAIFKKLEPTQNEIEIEKLESMLKKGLEIESGEPENALAGPTENLEEDRNKKKRRRRKKKSTMIEDIDEPYVCSICSVICDSPYLFECHLKGRKHAAKIKQHTEALLDDQHIQEGIIQDNGHSKDMTEELRVKPGEDPENIDYLDKQRQELRERFATSERRVEEFFKTVDVLENDYKSLPNAECILTELNPKFSATKEAREWVDDIFKNPELSQDANLTQEFESIPNQNLEMNSGDPESSSAGATKHPEEYMDMKKKDKVTKDKDEPEAYVCTLCSVICVCPIVFESHLMGRRHAAKVRKHAEVLFDDKNILEESLKEKDHPRDALEELQVEPKDAQVSIKEVSQSTKERVANENEQIPSIEFPEPKEASERLKRLEVSLEDTSQQTLVEAENASERVEEVMKTRKKNGATATLFTVCELCNVVGYTQMDIDSHMAGKRHAATLKKQGVYNLPKYVKKQTLVVAENASERVEEAAEARKENGAATTLFKVCELCNVMGNTHKNFDSHLAGKRHTATLKRQVAVVKK